MLQSNSSCCLSDSLKKERKVNHQAQSDGTGPAGSLCAKEESLGIQGGIFFALSISMVILQRRKCTGTKGTWSAASVSALWKHLLHRPLETASNSFLIHRICATQALQLTQKAKNNVKYPRVLWKLLPISNLANKSITVTGLVIRNQSIFLRAELKLQSKVLVQPSR